jgi:dynein heavy chain, axonemal
MGSTDEVQRLVSRTSVLIKPFAEIAFDPFSAKNAVLWKAIMSSFGNDVETIETDVKLFIDRAFKNLRSVDGALKIVMNFRKIKSREAINAQMMGKFGDILAQFEKQVCFLYHSVVFFVVLLINVNISCNR